MLQNPYCSIINKYSFHSKFKTSKEDLEAQKPSFSIAERIYQMETKLEERSAPVTRLGSGTGTPRLHVIR